MIQVTSQKLTEQVVMTENSKQFILAYSLPLLQLNTAHDLGYSGEGQLNRNALWNNADMFSSDARLKDLMKIFHSSSHTRIYPFVYADQLNGHWSRFDEKS